MAHPDIRYRVSGMQGILLRSTAALVDFGGLFLGITVVGDAATEGIDVVADPFFFLWFGMLGADFTGKNASSKLITMIGNSVAKLLPFVNMYPGYSIEVWRMLALMKKEDEEAAAEEAQKAEAKTKQMIARTMRVRARQEAEQVRAVNEARAQEAEAA